MNLSSRHRDHISVCVCTYRRNEMLARLLSALALQRTDRMFSLSIVVVDNDPTGGARSTVERARAGCKPDITYSIEPEHTIPAARNHALRLATGTYIGIIDDDEFPPPQWLLRLYEAIQTFKVDGALGPVRAFFPHPPPAWLTRSRICESPVHRTGTLLHWSQAFTNNVLVKKEVFDRLNLSFDARFKTGGSDQEFFRQAMQRGCRFIAVEEAPVYEIIPPVRWTRRYWAKRALVNGFNAERYASAGMSRLAQAKLAAKSLVAIPVYGAALCASLSIGQHRFVTYLEKVCYHFSRLCASFGIELWKRRDF